MKKGMVTKIAGPSTRMADTESNGSRNEPKKSVTGCSLEEHDSDFGIPEDCSEGSVKGGLYWKYFRSGGSILSLVVFTLTFLLMQAAYNASDYWLTVIKDASVNSNSVEGVYIYAALLCVAFLLSVISSIHFFTICVNAAVKLHSQMCTSILQAPMHFFDRNPSGMSNPIRFESYGFYYSPVKSPFIASSV